MQSVVVVPDLQLKYVYVGSLDGDLLKFDTSTNSIIQKENICNKIHNMVFDESGQYIYMSCEELGLITIKTTEEGFTNMKRPQTTPLTTWYVKVLLQGQNQLLAATAEGLVFYSNQDPSFPEQLTILADVGEGFQLDVSKDNQLLFLNKDAYGFFVYNINNPNDIKLVTSDVFAGTYGVKGVAVHPTQNYVYVASKFDYLAVIDFTDYYGNSNVPFVLAYKYIDPTFSEKYDMYLSNDGNNIYMTCNGQGIFVLDSSEPPKVSLVQILEQSSLIKKMAIPLIGKDFVYLTNSQDLIIYKLMEPIYKQNNLFTQYQSEKWDGPTLDVWPWTQVITHNNERLTMVLIVDGIRVFDASNMPNLVLQYEYLHPDIEGLTSPFHICVDHFDENIFYVGNYVEEGVFIIDFTDAAAPIKLGSVIFPDRIGYSVHIFKNDPNKMFVNIRTNVAIIDITDKTEPFEVSRSDMGEYSITQFRKGEASNSGQYIYMPELVLGQLFTFEVKDNYRNIQIINVQPLEVGYQLKIPSLRNDVMYLMVNLGGVFIYNIEDGIPVEICFVALEGVLWDIALDYQELNLFASAAQRNQLQTVDISDPYNAKLINVFQIGTEQAFQVIFQQNIGFNNQDKNYLVINTFNGIRAIPVDVDINMNIQVFKYSSKLDSYIDYEFPPQEERNSLFPEYFVGEIGKSQFQILDNPFGQKIDEFYYYTVEQPQLLIEQTDLVSFDTTKKEVNFLAIKDNLGINTVVTKVFIQIDKKDFIVEDSNNIGQFIIDETLSEELFTRAQEFGYISKDGFPTDLFDINNTIILLGSYQDYSQYLKNVLKLKIQLVPFSFLVSPSLVFNQQITEAKDDQMIIYTYSDNTEVIFKVDPQDGVFFEQTFQGVLSSYSEDHSEVTIQGKTSSINKILSQVKIETKGNTDTQSLLVYISIDDELNKRLEVQDSLSNIKFMKINQHVQVGEDIQTQFSSYYENNSISLEEEFSFSFSKESFVDDDDLQYSIKFWNFYENQFQEIQQHTTINDIELNFVQNERTIKGMVTRALYREELLIEIIATDGYSEAKQELKIKANSVPIVIILYYIILGGSSLFSVIGAIQYRGLLYGMFCKRIYRVGNIYIKQNEDFVIQIILGKDDTNKAKQHYKLLKNHINSRNIKMQKLIDSESILKHQYDRSKLYRILYVENPEISEVGYQNSEQILFNIIQSYFQADEFNNNKKFKKTKQLFKYMKQFAIKRGNKNKHRWYEYYLEIVPQQVINFQELLPKIYFRQKTLITVLELYLEKYKNIPNTFMIEQDLKIIEIENLDVCYELEDETFLNKIQELDTKFPDYDIQLLLINIRIDAWGLKPFSLINFTNGQIVNKRTQDIKIARAMVKRKSMFNPIFKYLNMDYVDIPLASNTPLPHWMDYTCHHNVIDIFGNIPIEESPDYQQIDIIIRIEDIYDFTCREFHIVEVANTTKHQIQYQSQEEKTNNMKWLQKKVQGLKNDQEEDNNNIDSNLNSFQNECKTMCNSCNNSKVKQIQNNENQNQDSDYEKQKQMKMSQFSKKTKSVNYQDDLKYNNNEIVNQNKTSQSQQETEQNVIKKDKEGILKNNSSKQLNNQEKQQQTPEISLENKDNNKNQSNNQQKLQENIIQQSPQQQLLQQYVINPQQMKQQQFILLSNNNSFANSSNLQLVKIVDQSDLQQQQTGQQFFEIQNIDSTQPQDQKLVNINKDVDKYDNFSIQDIDNVQNQSMDKDKSNYKSEKNFDIIKNKQNNVQTMKDRQNDSNFSPVLNMQSQYTKRALLDIQDDS